MSQRSMPRSRVLVVGAGVVGLSCAVRLLEAGHRVDVVARVRQYLADDLDTPKALAALDGWATDALEYGGRDTAAGRMVATIADALLGVQL